MLDESLEGNGKLRDHLDSLYGLFAIMSGYLLMVHGSQAAAAHAQNFEIEKMCSQTFLSEGRPSKLGAAIYFRKRYELPNATALTMILVKRLKSKA